MEKRMSMAEERKSDSMDVTQRSEIDQSVTGRMRPMSNQATQQQAKSLAVDIDPPKLLNLAAFDSGRADGLAGKDPVQSSDPSDDAYKSYLLGWKRGHEDAEQTQTSSAPSQRPFEDKVAQGPLSMPDFLTWAPSATADTPVTTSARPSYEGPRAETSDPYDPDKFTLYDQAKVEKIINDMESTYLRPRGPDGKRPVPAFDVKQAWLDLKASRDEYPYDTNLACAEHYMFARYAAHIGVGLPPLMFLQAGLYQVAKSVPGNFGDDPNSPRTPPSIEEFDWAMEGSLDGTADRM